jgi:hypothetical protein
MHLQTTEDKRHAYNPETIQQDGNPFQIHEGQTTPDSKTWRLQDPMSM